MPRRLQHLPLHVAARAARAHAGLTQDALAEISGVSAGHLKALESVNYTSIHGPGVLLVRALATSCGLSVSEYIGEVAPPKARRIPRGFTAAERRVVALVTASVLEKLREVAT